MKIFFYIFIALTATVRFATAADAPAVIHIIDFRQTDNLKAIFDAGIHPFRIPGLEDTECEFDREKLRVLLPGNLNFSVDSDLCQISVLADNKIISIGLYAPKMKLDDGIEYTRKIANELGMDTKNLDQTKIDDGSRDYVDKLSAWTGYLAKVNVEIQLRLHYVHTDYEAFTELYVGVSWDQPGGITHPLMGPIQPPPGYENISMDPPTGWGHSSRAPNPGQSTNSSPIGILGKSITPLNAVRPDSTSASIIPENATGTNSSPNSLPKTSAGISSSQTPLLTPKNGWWVLLGVVVLLLAAYVLRRNK